MRRRGNIIHKEKSCRARNILKEDGCSKTRQPHNIKVKMKTDTKGGNQNCINSQTEGCKIKHSEVKTRKSRFDT